MYQNGGLENLEIKLQNAKLENEQAFIEAEKSYNENYKDFVESLFKTDVLGAKKTISALFQLEKLNGKNGKESLGEALEKGLKILPLKLEQKEKLKTHILHLEKNKDVIPEIIIKSSDFSRSYNSPILESLHSQKVLDGSDMLSIYTLYQEKRDIRLSLGNISQEKRDIVLEYFYGLNSSKREERISNFTDEYSNEIKGLERKYSGPVINGVVSFVGRNFFKMKPYKKKLESRKMRLRRTFKIALLKLLRIKYSGFSVEKLLKKVDTISDFNSMFSLIQKLIDVIPERNELLEKYSLQEQVDEGEELIVEAEGNKEKILDGEENIVKISQKISKMDGIFAEDDLEKLLDEDTDFVGNKLEFRKEQDISKEDVVITANTEERESDDEEKKIDIEEEYEKLKHTLFEVEKKKQGIFASGDFDLLDEINEELLEIMVKIGKIEKLLLIV